MAEDRQDEAREQAGPDGLGGARPDGVRREVDLPGDVDDVWVALTDPDHVRAWFGAAVSWDVEPGATVAIGEADDGAAPREGRVEEVDPGRLLRFRSWPVGGGAGSGASVVTYVLAPTPLGTHLVITERPLPPFRPGATALAASGGGWDVRLVGLWLGLTARPRCRA